jgi:predicted transcriptional regulator of viral defense system
MRYLDFRANFNKFIVFSLNDIKKIEPNFHRPQLNWWQGKGYIKKLRRGFYMFSDTPLDEGALFTIANRLYSPSYISLESALSYYGLIPEGVYSITSVSTKKTTAFNSPIATFTYHRIKTNLHFGYHLEKHGEQTYKIADMEKAVLDYLYLHPTIVEENNFYEWRFNESEFVARVDMKKLKTYGKAFGSKQLLKRLDVFIKRINK